MIEYLPCKFVAKNDRLDAVSAECALHSLGGLLAYVEKRIHHILGAAAGRHGAIDHSCRPTSTRQLEEK